jgi:chromosomal replication initiator protein
MGQPKDTTPEGASAAAGLVWTKASHALKHELGEDTFGSWLSQAALKSGAVCGLCLVTPTGVARDWILRHAWRRIGELWAANDPEGRSLSLKSRVEFEAECGQPTATQDASAPVDVALEAACGPRTANCGVLQDRFNFDSFVVGPTNEFGAAVARRVASWADGHFNPVVFHGPYGFGKTHLLNALAWEAMKVAPGRRVVYLTAERFLSRFVRALM